MKNFTAGSVWVLGLLTLISFIGLFIIENDKIDYKRKWYEEKLEASKLARTAQDILKEERLQKGIFIDAVNDPNRTALIGQDITPITTDRGYIEAKLTSLNPNFAAVVVEMLKEAGLKEGDAAAVSFTGSFPALNIAVHSALQTLKIKPVIITSEGASNWGANDPYYTWLDMEKILFDAGIFKYRSIAASYGGGLDRGRGLSPEGRSLIHSAIERNGVELINDEYLENNIERRLEIYRQNAPGPIKIFINVGGGIASIGSIENYQFIPGGYSPPLSMKNFPIKGVLIRMSEKNIPFIHLLNITQLAHNYGLPASPSPLPLPGEGEIFIQKRYNITLTSIITVILAACIITILVFEKKRHKLGTEFVTDAMSPEKTEFPQHELTEL
ncbi:MAG TPA: poly-gamma-glutamate system protein [Ignavibacteriaceae bacterium]|nr:poly-gamma-glutamate system protein [Ignavibacteriaceae bacterium]